MWTETRLLLALVVLVAGLFIPGDMGVYLCGGAVGISGTVVGDWAANSFERRSQ